MQYDNFLCISIVRSRSRAAHKIGLVPTGKGLSHPLVSVLLSRSCSFEQVSVDRPKSSIWPIIIPYADIEWPMSDGRGRHSRFGCLVLEGHSVASECHDGFFFTSSCRGGRDLTMKL